VDIYQEINHPKKIHDPLYLKCVSVSDEKNRVFIITSDLIGFTPDFVNSLKKEIYKELKIETIKNTFNCISYPKES